MRLNQRLIKNYTKVAMKQKTDAPQPTLSIQSVNRILVILVVIFALLAGYFHAKWQDQIKKAAGMENPAVDRF